MNIREQIEEREALLLSPYAAKSRDAIRDIAEKPDPLRTAFQRDRDRIIHSKCFRRLKHKTQVYIAPGDHYRTRMTHTLEVGQIGRTVARALRLNEDLVEAIAMGHDVGHTPFGHVGEYALRDMVGHFNHNEQSLRMVEVLERHGDHQGLNLTTVVRDGIVGHTGATIPVTLEGQIIRIVDRIAYLCHDFDDAQRAGMLTAEVFKHVYLAPALIPDRKKASHVVKNLFTHFMEHPDDMEGCEIGKAFYSTRDVVDYVAGLTDQYAIKLFKQYYIPNITL
ncbi:MAG: HD domain-containing protein [Veillonella sp.]|nr:HD domain-containing protein [Veillonella sp.]